MRFHGYQNNWRVPLLTTYTGEFFTGDEESALFDRFEYTNDDSVSNANYYFANQELEREMTSFAKLILIIFTIYLRIGR